MNLLYIAVTCPLYIGFNIEAAGLTLVLEVISHLVSGFVIWSNFRTPLVDEKGEKSVDLEKLFKHYLKNGLVVDVFGMLPLNIVLSLSFRLRGPDVQID